MRRACYIDEWLCMLEEPAVEYINRIISKSNVTNAEAFIRTIIKGKPDGNILLRCSLVNCRDKFGSRYDGLLEVYGIKDDKKKLLNIVDLVITKLKIPEGLN